jgi:putative transposase
MANQVLLEEIEVVYNDSDETYGSPRVTQALQKQGVACSENRVARLMRLRGLKAKQTRRFRTTTRRNKSAPVAPNLLQRSFEADRPNEKWLADITYIATQEGWLYLATILDVYSRRIVGWAMSDRMKDELTIRALEMALERRHPEPGLIHHSDQGSQYTSEAYQALLKDHDIRPSMNGVGTWYDNAPMESFFGTLKRELVHHVTYPTRNAARVSLFEYIEGFYNRRRIHSTLDYVSPVAFEQAFYQQSDLCLSLCL